SAAVKWTSSERKHRGQASDAETSASGSSGRKRATSVIMAIRERDTPPFDDRRPPGHARSEGAKQNPISFLQATVLIAIDERERQARRRGVALLADAIDYALGLQGESFADRLKDAPVCLVVDEQIDLIKLHARGLRGLEGRPPQPAD